MRRICYCFSVSVMLVVLISACAKANKLATADSPGISYNSNEYITQGGEIMEETLLTEEEFLKLVEKHGSYLDVTVEDFNSHSFDLEAFIIEKKISEARFNSYVTDPALKNFLRSWIIYYNEPLLTREEFLELVEEHRSVLDVTVQDFDEIDVDGFISYDHTSRESFLGNFVSGRIKLSQWLDDYIKYAPLIEREQWITPYLAYELQYADSADAEFMEFIDKFLETVDMEVYSREWKAEGDKGDVYDVVLVGSTGKTGMTFIQTCKTEDYRFEKCARNWLSEDKDEFYRIERYTGDDMTQYSTVFYSRSGKYLMTFPLMSADERFEDLFIIIKTFCEMDD